MFDFPISLDENFVSFFMLDGKFANPIAQILSAALMLRFSLGLEAEAASIEAAVRQVIGDGLRTGDIFTGAPGTKLVNTAEMGAAIVSALG